MTLNEYQTQAYSTALENARNRIYMVLGLSNEAGEVAGKMKKLCRRDYHGNDALFLEHLAAEMGDTLWYLAGLAQVSGLDLEQIAAENLAKLADRKQRGVLQGNGDQR